MPAGARKHGQPRPIRSSYLPFMIICVVMGMWRRRMLVVILAIDFLGVGHFCYPTACQWIGILLVEDILVDQHSDDR